MPVMRPPAAIARGRGWPQWAQSLLSSVCRGRRRTRSDGDGTGLAAIPWDDTAPVTASESGLQAHCQAARAGTYRQCASADWRLVVGGRAAQPGSAASSQEEDQVLTRSRPAVGWSGDLDPVFGVPAGGAAGGLGPGPGVACGFRRFHARG
jgi:hypothetical protein